MAGFFFASRWSVVSGQLSVVGGGSIAIKKGLPNVTATLFTFLIAASTIAATN